MSQETRQCRNCSSEFVIESEDFDFYEKVQVPPPTWCPDCRQMRRYAWRNERVLYRRNCDLCGKSTVTIYSPNKPYKVYCPPCWWSDGWDAFSYGREFDFSRPFFDQFKELQLQVPRIALLTKRSVNSEYTNHSGDIKNCYLSFGVWDGENHLYCTNIYGTPSRDCVDCYHIISGGELLYECIDCQQCYQCQFGFLLRACNDCLYCVDCRGCSNCFLSCNLRNKQYCILNKQYSKEDYVRELQKYDLNSSSAREKLYHDWLDLIRAQALHRFAVIENSVRVTGNQIVHSKNAQHMFDGHDTEDSRHVVLCLEVKNSMDAYHFGYKSELIYESHGLTRGYNCRFTHLCYDDMDLQYCDNCHNSQHLFGCNGIKKGSYLIFNKQYDEASYHELEEKIIKHMKSTGEYGEFFPPQISPVAYNETQGMVYMPLTKEEVLARGWQWEERVPGTYGKETITPEQLPDTCSDVPDSITKEALRCIECNRNYNIVEPELAFYRRNTIPIPRHCPDCRYKRRTAIRSPRKLWKRECQCNATPSRSPSAQQGGEDAAQYKNTAQHFHGGEPCPNEFETPYAPERSEVVYCEQCYNAEVV